MFDLELLKNVLLYFIKTDPIRNNKIFGTIKSVLRSGTGITSYIRRISNVF